MTTIEQTQVAKWEQEGYQTSKESGVSFIVSFGQKESESYDKEKYSNFTRYLKNIHASTMGGEPFDAIQGENKKENSSDCSTSSSKLTEWMQSVSRNPVIIKFNTLSMQNLLTRARFPSDPKIDDKATAFQVTLNKFNRANPVRCFQSCSGKGDCIPAPSGSGGDLFNHGTCKCGENFSGPACATPSNPTAPTPPTTPYRTTIPH